MPARSNFRASASSDQPPTKSDGLGASATADSSERSSSIWRRRNRSWRCALGSGLRSRHSTRCTELGDLGLAPAVQPALGDELLQARLGRVGDADRQADQARRGLAAAPCRRTHLVDHEPVGGDGLVAMLDADSAGRSRCAPALGDGAQVGEVVRPETAAVEAGGGVEGVGCH